MYYNFNFDEDSEFFKKSKTMVFMIDSLNQHYSNDLKKYDIDTIRICLKLWGESIIKHNLNRNMHRIDPSFFITDKNSQEVLDTIATALNKPNREKTDKDSKLIRAFYRISILIESIVISSKEDVCLDIKQEFVEYQQVKNNIYNLSSNSL